MSDSIIERLRHHAKDERNTAFARSTMREAELEIEQQRLSEEGAKEAFAHVVQQKQDLEAKRKRLGGLLDDAYKIIRQKERELAASREREARMRDELSKAADLINKASACSGLSPDGALSWWSETGKFVAEHLNPRNGAALAEGAQG